MAESLPERLRALAEKAEAMTAGVENLAAVGELTAADEVLLGSALTALRDELDPATVLALLEAAEAAKPAVRFLREYHDSEPPHEAEDGCSVCALLAAAEVALSRFA